MRRSPTGACQCSRGLASPGTLIQQADHRDVVPYPIQPRQRHQCVLMAAARPAAVHPQQVAVDARDGQALGGVGVPLGVVRHLLVGPPSGSLHPDDQPVRAHRLAGASHLRKPPTQVVEDGRGDRVQADLQVQRSGAALSGSARRAQVGEAGGQRASQPSTLAGNEERGQYDANGGQSSIASLNTLPMV
jgi:hypothetical protein